MDKVFIEKIKHILESEKKSILLRTKSNTHIDIDIDGDETDEIQGKILALTTSQLVARDKENFLKIENAIKKIEEGTFGSCEECGEEIAEKRLLINPGFITCIGCAEHLEMLKKRSRA